MSEQPMWMVRAGEGAFAIDDFRTRGLVAVGWADNGTRWIDFPDRDAIQRQMTIENPEKTAAQNLVAARQLDKFIRGFKIGDRVISYDPRSRKYLVGTIRSNARHEEVQIPELQTARSVEWEKGDVSRDDLSTATRNSLGAISTLFRVPTSMAAEIEGKLVGQKSNPLQTQSDDTTEQPQDDATLLKDVQERSKEFIKDRLSQLDWDQMQRLVAGLLRAMGYKTRISPPGPDRGKDIVASPDGFGFEPPRIVVEVKHRNQTMGANEVRAFIGGRHKDDRGLYVSTGGFSREAQYEADRSPIPLTLMDADGLVAAIAEYYDQMDAEARSLIPLVRLYWPA